jgi:hypothetical protein
MRWLNSWNSSKAWFDKGRWKASMGSLRSRMFFTEASLLIAKEWSLGNLIIGRSEVQLSLQKSAVSPDAMEQEAMLLNFEQSLAMSLHQKELEMLVLCGQELL